MWAITFDFDTNLLKENYHNSSWRNAYFDIESFLAGFGFVRQQGSVYFGNENVTAVICVTTVQALSTEFDWVATSVKDIRMLKIEENNDLMPAIKGSSKKKINKLRFVS